MLIFFYGRSGIGATTIYVIGAPYLDDSIPNNESPFYFGKLEYSFDPA